MVDLRRYSLALLMANLTWSCMDQGGTVEYVAKSSAHGAKDHDDEDHDHDHEKSQLAPRLPPSCQTRKDASVHRDVHATGDDEDMEYTAEGAAKTPPDCRAARSTSTAQD